MWDRLVVGVTNRRTWSVGPGSYEKKFEWRMTASPVTTDRVRRIKVRWLLLALVVCAGSSIYLWWWESTLRAQADSRTRLIKMGAFVETAPPKNDWLRGLAGEHFRQRTVKVNFIGVQVRETDLSLFANLPDVEEICLFGAMQVGDDGLSHLAHLQQLRTLNLVRTGVRGPGLRKLTSLPNLEELSFGPEASDGTLHELAELPQLQRVSLTSSMVTLAGLRQLAKLPNLRRVQLVNTPLVTAEDARQLKIYFQDRVARSGGREGPRGDVEVVYTTGY